MAYLHCHTKGCDWAQDDFWDRHYNPLTKIKDDIKWLWKPHWFEMDADIVSELRKFTGVQLSYRLGSCPGQVQVHSWQWLRLELVKEWKVFREMKWRTWGKWKKAWANRTENFPVCPKCGLQDFDID